MPRAPACVVLALLAAPLLGCAAPESDQEECWAAAATDTSMIQMRRAQTDSSTQPTSADPAEPNVTSCVGVSGYAALSLGDGARFRVLCSQDAVVIQQRWSRSVDFYRTWDDYKRGFGDDDNFWLGNELITLIAPPGKPVPLRIDLMDGSGQSGHAEYSSFSVSGESDKYRLSVGGYSGNIGDSLSPHSGYAFSTKDVDNDAYGGSCSNQYYGGWWYSSCHSSNLNGRYEGPGPVSTYATSVCWKEWRGYYHSMMISRMSLALPARPTAEPTAAPTAAPSATPTASPTPSPTMDPTAAPTGAPTATPTTSPTPSPTTDPTAGPTKLPTATPTPSPTPSPTGSPTAAPTATPTAKPTASPTPSPTPSPTTDPTAGPTKPPTATPTPSPTPSPTPPPTGGPTAAAAKVPIATAKGDPHLVNVLGQRFDLMQPGRHVLVQIPRGATGARVLLRAEADAKRIGGACADIYFTSVDITGSWAGGAAGVRYDVKSAAAPSREWVQLGKVSVKVVKGRTPKNVAYLNVMFKGLEKVGVEIGGLLGGDDHAAAAAVDPRCRGSKTL